VSAADRTLGFPWPVLVALAALAAPGVVLHDLGVIEEGSVVNGLFVVIPPACWIAAVLWKRSPGGDLVQGVGGPSFSPDGAWAPPSQQGLLRAASRSRS
jgi:hypothetical protein